MPPKTKSHLKAENPVARARLAEPEDKSANRPSGKRGGCRRVTSPNASGSRKR